MDDMRSSGMGLESNGVVGAVILAAGAGSRMGNHPKCLLEFEGMPLIRRLLNALTEAGIDEVVVVLGHYAERIESATRDFSLTLVRNPVPESGQVSSLRLGLQALTARVDTALVVLADQPLINGQDIVDLLVAYQTRPEGTHVVQPHVEGLPGNPVAFSASVRDEILGSEAMIGCKQWQEAHPCQVHRWISSNVHYRIDIDSPQDIKLLALLTGHQLLWPGIWKSQPALPPVTVTCPR